MAEYATEMSKWLNLLQTDYRECLPQNFNSYMPYLMDNNVSDAERQNRASQLYAEILNYFLKKKTAKSDTETGENVVYHLVPTVCSNGNMYYTDLNGHGQIRILKRSNGAFEIYGPRALFTVLGGRGETDTILRRIEDSDYFHDKKR